MHASLADRLRFSWRQLRHSWRARAFAQRAASFPLKGHPPGRDVPLIDLLPDAQLAELNGILRWQSFVVDRTGRRFGAPGSHRRADRPQTFPNKRTQLMHDTFDLRGRRVLEIGCFEGLHTLGLCDLGAEVTAIDSRVENVVKTIVRTALFDRHPRVFVCDVERQPLPEALLAAEYCHHVGVLYHLKDPVTHIGDLGRLISHGLLLDTHYALDEEADRTYAVGNETFRYRYYGEFGYTEVLSGMYDHAKWLTLPTILSLLERAGFSRVRMVEPRVGTQGPRVLILAEKERGDRR